MSIRASRLYSACLQLGEHAGKFIRNVWHSKELDSFEKSYDNPCTAADLGSQKLIAATLLRYFPNLCIIGEENVTLEEKE